ncbi:medium-chain acyl-[acyl-carrier-protein] hydrolase [Nocardiopsis sp. Huas11]|uniref:thioesterase II family protein n=1 Tax=Nocardiopsis sp. Huas11 TaxID=2183912 RepID=UPI000EB19DD5|nr:alpha/beta fold hydrolase [Nocardiopsis sp. Huas11]RKS09662.1 medium-chain acyl-[acyl-carrier-protein] hydrolase [Nocardiopsis sp. Huas11]
MAPISPPGAVAVRPAPSLPRSSAMRPALPLPGATLRLVCFPHSGGGPGVFHRWGSALAPDVEVWPVTLPGRAARTREPFARDWPSLVREMTAAVLDSGEGPVALFGHSLGAAVAFEVARALTRAGEPPVHLVVSARSAPRTQRARLDLPGDDEGLLRLVDRVYRGVPDAVHDSPELRAHFAPILRADLELSNSYAYEPGPALPCPVTALGGRADGTVTEERLRAWADHTRGGFESHLFPGGHFYLEDAEHLVLNTLWRRIVRA